MVVHRLANALADAGGMNVTVYSMDALPPGARYGHRRLFGPFSWLNRNPLARFFVLPALLNFVRFGPADVLHIHGDDWFYLWRPIPTVRTIHGSALFEARTAASWKRRVEQYCLVPMEWLSARLCRISLAIGTQTARLYRTKYGIDNGIDLEVFHPGPKTAHPQVLYVGTWSGRKRGKFLFNAFVNEVLPRNPDAKLCFVSDYCPEHPSVLYRRFPSDEELAGYFRQSWVFAYPSVYEGFGLAYLEAMASGTAVLTSPNDGSLHVLDGGKAGVIASDAEFAARLNELLGSPALRESFEKSGLDRARQFSWSAIAERHRAIYREAIG